LGIGLAISRTIAEAYKGTFTTSNRKTDGARFSTRFARIALIETAYSYLPAKPHEEQIASYRKM